MRSILADRIGLGGPYFAYTRIFDCRERAVLEFETRLGGVEANGAQLVEWDSDGRITDYKMMLRPSAALDAFVGRIEATLETENKGGQYGRH